jgi:hypothetical protein
MTTIHITNANGLKRIVCKGHATGSSEACGVISLLCMALLEHIEDADGYIRDGECEISFRGYDGEFALFMTAVRMLAREMPEACKIIENNIVTL